MLMYVGAHVCIWTSLVFYFTTTVIYIDLCSPRSKIYNPAMKTGHCYDTSVTFKATGIFSVISDFAILILPLQSIWKLRMPLRRKVLISMIFATGIL